MYHGVDGRLWRAKNGELRRGGVRRRAFELTLLLRTLSYVLELRSLITHYVNPLLHPLLSPTPVPHPPSPPAAFSPSPLSSSELPIAARFQRSNNNSDDSLVRPPSVQVQHRHQVREMPEINGSSDDSSFSHSSRAGAAAARSHMSLPVLPRDGRPSFSIFGSSHSLAHPGEAKSGRLSSFSFRPSRGSRGSAQQAKPSSVKAPVKALNDDGTPLTIPEPLRNVLESMVEMLRGHEELSLKL